MTMESKRELKTNLKKLFSLQIGKHDFESVFWFKSIPYSDVSLKFIYNNLKDLDSIFSFNDKKARYNDDDVLELYLCIEQTDKSIHLVIIHSPFEYYDSEKIIKTHMINSKKSLLVIKEKYKLTQIW